MSSKKNPTLTRGLRLCAYFALMILVLTTFNADIGPKPSANFTLTYETSTTLDIVEYALMQCEDAACATSYPLEDLGPQGIDCTQFACTSFAYGYADTMQLVITFSDGVTRRSNLFGKENFNADYNVTVRATDLLVEEVGGSASPYETLATTVYVIIGSVCCLGLAVVVLIIFLIVRKRRARKAEAI